MHDFIASFDCDGPMGASLTTSVAVAQRFARHKSIERASNVGWNLDSGVSIDVFQPSESLQWSLFGDPGGGGGYIAFDANQLEKVYPLIEYDELGDNSEKEVRLLGDKIIGILDAVDHVVIPNQDNFFRYASELVVADGDYLAAIVKVIEHLEAPSPILISTFQKRNNLGLRR